VNDAFGHPQSAVILGGTSDIARAIVRRLASQRCRTVALAARDPARLREAAGEAEACGAKFVHTLRVEATEVAGAAGAVDRAFEMVGEVDLVLMAVGMLGHQSEDERDPARAAELAAVNYAWPVAALTRAFDRLEGQGHGRVVVLSSVAGVRVRRANYLYGSAKAGLDGFAVGLSEAARGSGVAVQIVRPGFVHSKMTEGLPPAPFATTPDVVAEAVIQGLSTDQTVIWVPPALRFAFAGLRLLPQSLWRRLPG
jgi:decaprenylphospho-beta-D-erythro-pentofuranosid-2-ulose 2-reductase